MSEYRLSYDDRNRKLDGIHEDRFSITKAFAFPNRPTCISLTKDGEIIDQLCYGDPEDDQQFCAHDGDVFDAYLGADVKK